MAYFNNQEDEEENSQGMNQQDQAPTGTGSAPVQLGSQSGSLGGAGNGNVQKAPAAPKPAPSSGSAPGFQNYAKANVGIAQGRLNNAAAKNVTNQGQQAKTAIGQATTGFGQRVDAGSLANRETAVQDVSNITGAARQTTAAPKPLQATSQPQQPTNGLAVEPTQGNVPVAPKGEQAPSALTDEQTNRFSDVINAQYKGPESLRQAGLYQLASGKVGTAQNTLNQTKTTGGREEMLKNMYSQRGDYTTGLNKLDSALLNASKQGVQNLQNAATEQGNVEKQLDRAQIDSAIKAQNRTNELQDIKNEAMGVFSQGKKDEEAATEKRLNDMLVTPVKDASGKDIMKPDGTPMTQWDQLPESFRDIIRNKTANNKSMLDTEVGKVKAGVDYDSLAPSLSKAKNLLAREQARLQQADRAGYAFGSNTSTITDAEREVVKAKAQKNYDKALAAYNSINTQKSGLDQQIAALTQKYNPNATVFNDFEAGVLGVNSGEGLYNLGENAIKSGVAERDRLVSRDEQTRQAVLAQLAGLDKSNRLDTNLRYADADKAGTQSILDSLDTEGTRGNLNAAEKGFEDTAKGTTITGEGKKKVSRGNAFGTTTKTYKASMKGNAGDFLKKAGYNFDDADENANVGGQKELLNAALQASSGASAGEGSTYQDAIKSAMTAGVTGPVGGLDTAQRGLESVGLDGLSNIIQDGRNVAGNASEQYARMATMGGADLAKSMGLGDFAGGIGSAIGGIDTGAMAAMGNQVAKQKAAEDLKKKYSSFLGNQGFNNRINVENNATTDLRSNSLQQLLASLDKTNTQS